VAVLGLVLIPGTDVSGRPYHMDFFHAFYVVTYTVTTIGFGELPHAFNDGQRLWMIFSIYLGVVAWAYAIGTIITLVQEPALRQAVTESRFAHGVARLTSRFYIVCGYGDTGGLVVRDMTEHGLNAVVLESHQDRINELLLEDLDVYVPGLCTDAGHAANLELAGLRHPRCAGVLAITNDDHVNLRIGIAAKLLNPRLTVICRAELPETRESLEACGTGWRWPCSLRTCGWCRNGSPSRPAAPCRAARTRRSAPGCWSATGASARRCIAISASSASVS
jgi:hypothetical protein